jgi:hypothetical protein
VKEGDVDEDSTIEVQVTMKPYQALRFACAMRRLAEMSTAKEDREFWRSIYHEVGDQCAGVYITSRRHVWRPAYDDEVALKRVVDGDEPFPVLSRMDARRALVALKDKLSARQLGERLYMDRRTASMWRAAYNRGEWKKYGF